MGGSLSKQENAYKQLSRDLKGQGDGYMHSVNSFLTNFENFESESDIPSLQAKDKNTPHILIECLQSEIRGSKINGENVYSLLLAIQNVMCISNAYIAAAENPSEVVDTLLDVLRRKESLSAKCIAAVIATISKTLFRCFCLTQNKYDSYQDSFRAAFDNAKGSQIIVSCLNWEKDENYTACEAACSFFNIILNTHREEQTCSVIADCLACLAPFISHISVLTTKCQHPSIQLLLKSILLCSSRKDLHKHQVTLLQNGSFLYHLNQAIQNKTNQVTFSQEFVSVCMADSAEGYRVLTRIFPTPLTKKLDVAMGSTRLKGVSYSEPLQETAADTKILDNMALTTVFIPLRVNWSGFWNSLSMTNQSFNFIWNSEMRDYLLSALHSELEDIRLQEAKGSVSWDYDGFRIIYPQLEEFICVDGYYLQQMIDAFVAMESGSPKVELIKPVEFIRHLCDSIIVSRDLEEKRGMFYLIYQVVKLEEEACKDFPIMRYVCYLLEERTLDPVIEFYCMRTLEITCQKQRNTEQFFDYNGLQSLTVNLVYYIQYLMEEQPPLCVESSRYNLPPLTIHYLDRIRLIIRILRHSCDCMLRIRNRLISEPILSRLLRCLLAFRDEPVTQDLLSILSLSLASSTKYQAMIYKSGLFRILLNASCSDNGMSNEVAQLLYQYHSVQETEDMQYLPSNGSEKTDAFALLKNPTPEQRVEYARNFSYLRFFLPIPMIVLLTREGPSAFREVFNSQSTIRPDVVWDRECRHHLFEQTSAMLLEYTGDVTSNPSVDWAYSVPEQINYEKIESLLEVNDVFLDCYHQEGALLPATVDPIAFLNALVQELDRRFNMLFGLKGQIDDIVYNDIALIQASMYKLICESRDITKVDKQAFTVLGRSLASDLSIEKNREIVTTSFDIILEALQPASFGKPQPHIVYEAVDANLILDIDTLLVHLSNATFARSLGNADSLLYHIFTKAINCIAILSGKSTPRALESLVTNSSFVHHLIHFISPDNLELYPNISVQILCAFKMFLQEEKLLEVAVNCGILFFCMYIVISHDCTTQVDIEIIKSAENCVELLAGVDNSFTPSKTVIDAIYQLLTPGLVKSLKNHNLLMDIRSENIYNPILIWNQDMANVLFSLIENEINKIMDSTSTTGSYWNAQAFCHHDSYLHVYPCLLNEIIVDEVFLNAFLQNPLVELVDPTPEHFLMSLLVHIAQLESSQEVSFRQNKANFIECLHTCLESTLVLLQNHSELNSIFINDCNVRKLFTLLRKTDLGLEIQDLLLALFEISVSIPEGCSILSSFIPDLGMVLETNNNETQKSVLYTLEKFIATNNPQVIHLIMSHSLILKLLDMFLFYENEYDGNVQEMAVHIIGLMINADQGDVVSSYISTLFYPLFNYGNEKYSVLMQCGDYTENFINCINDTHSSPTIYWNRETREDLLNFLRNEARTLRTSNALYDYSAEEVAKRFKSSQVTIHQQLMVENIFIYQYNNYPICDIESSLFVNGIINELSNRLATIQNSEKDSKDFAALVQSLNLFLKGGKTIEASLYTVILSFYIQMIRENVSVAQDAIISTVETIVKQKAGLAEFVRNNRATSERSFIVDLLASSYLVSNRNGYAFRIAEIVKSVIMKEDELLQTCFSAGVLFYAFYFIFSDIQHLDSSNSIANLYLHIMQSVISTNPLAEQEALEFTTSQFKQHLQSDASILMMFMRKSHEATAEEANTVRVWSDTSREAIMKTIEQMIMRLNVESFMNAGWDRTSARYAMEEITQTWKKHTRVMTVFQKYNEEPTAIKLRTSNYPRLSTSPNEQIDSD